jgi:hypothetical protein
LFDLARRQAATKFVEIRGRRALSAISFQQSASEQTHDFFAKRKEVTDKESIRQIRISGIQFQRH